MLLAALSTFVAALPALRAPSSPHALASRPRAVVTEPAAVELSVNENSAHAGAPVDTRSGVQVGELAPELALPRWLAGTPAYALEAGKVHFIVFWAPWSGASTQSLTRIGDTQRRNTAAGLVVTAVAGSDARGATFTGARDRLRELVPDAPFRCGWDETGAVQRAWLGAAGERAFPCAFLVDRSGHVAAIGAPGIVELRLARVLEDEHDLAALAREEVDHTTVEANVMRAQSAFQTACRALEWERALALCDELLRVDPDGHRRMVVARFQILLLRLGKADAAYDYGRELLEGAARDDIGSLAILAWTVVDPDQHPPRRDLEFAGACAQRAVDLSQRRNATLLDTLARVHHAQGDLEQAILIEAEAARLDASFAGTLAEYVRGRG